MEVRWRNYLVGDWTSGVCDSGTIVEQPDDCRAASDAFHALCAATHDVIQCKVSMQGNACVMLCDNSTDLVMQDGLLERTYHPRYAPVCKVDVQQLLSCPPTASDRVSARSERRLSRSLDSRPVWSWPEEVSWGHFIVRDWGETECSIGKRVDDNRACESALRVYKQMCGSPQLSLLADTSSAQPGCHLTAGAAGQPGEVHFNSNMGLPSGAGHAPVCFVERPQKTQCYHGITHVLRWEVYVAQDWSGGSCSMGQSVTTYKDCVSAFSLYQALCLSTAQYPENLTHHGPPGCYIQAGKDAAFYFNGNLNGTAVAGFSPVCQLLRKGNPATGAKICYEWVAFSAGLAWLQELRGTVHIASKRTQR
eukprot:TRINITY_DN57782_c0_g1_i1.p1 TRINITY_DN57782_c0_g1~~TRINITY_DN57782_c0_g1_i1.p1  ORF type:complete len:364 (+),score=13.94 TRINITY_DN57782_c0_g1_i1:156-1247(+)